MEKSRKRPRDANQLAKRIVDIATDREIERREDGKAATSTAENSRGKRATKRERNH